MKWIIALAIMLMIMAQALAQTPGTVDGPSIETVQILSNHSGIMPIVTENGKISLSIDALGMTNSSGIIQVQKPAGATVRNAYMAAADVWGSNQGPLDNGAVQIEGTDVTWDDHVSLYTNNAWADVTSIVKPIVDAAPAGRVDLDITEPESTNIDGSILAVIFDDPNQAADNTIVLLFGAQAVGGDTFAVGLADPIDKSNPNLIVDMSLGISYSYQSAGQYSLVDVNGMRLTSSAGGQDDGEPSNGALITAGGLDDNITNPADPNANDAGGPRYDDELYNLLPFVEDNDTNIEVFTQNPSNDDNIFFAAFFFGDTTAVVGEGIVLSPSTATNLRNTTHTVTATLQDDTGAPIVGREVSFEIISGPHANMTGNDTTDEEGKATFTYMGYEQGIDTIVATYINDAQQVVRSNTVEKEWLAAVIPEFGIIGMVAVITLVGVFLYFRR